MKKFLLIACCLFVISFAADAQRYAVIDSKYILEKMPEYKDAQGKLDEVSAQWQQEIEKKQADLDRMYKDYDAEQVMLSDELKKKMTSEQIAEAEKLAKELNKAAADEERKAAALRNVLELEREEKRLLVVILLLP